MRNQLTKIQKQKKEKKMSTSLSPMERKKFTDLIGEMICLIGNINAVFVDDSLIEEYLINVSRIDDKNPIKDLLLLKKSFIDDNVLFYSEPSDNLKELKLHDYKHSKMEEDII